MSAPGGELWVWGRNTQGQLGLNSTDEKFSIPKQLTYISKVKQVSCGREHTGIVTVAGELYTLGSGGYGKLGHGDSLDLFQPKRVEMLGMLVMKSVACATEHTMALTDNGEVYSWGYNSQGRLGQSADFLSAHVSVPRMLGRLVGTFIDSIGCGGASSFALSKRSQVLYTWGANQFGQLGLHSTEECFTKPTAVDFFDASGTKPAKVAVVQAAIGEGHMACVTDNGALYLWGRNDDFRLGFKNVSKPIVAQPVLHDLSASTKFVKVSCGGRTTGAITNNDQLYCWQFLESQGAPSAKNPLLPTFITLADKHGNPQPVVDVAVGGTCGGHTVCVTKNGQVWSWGKNNFGQTARPAVAHRKNTDRMIPMMIPYIQNPNSIFCGGYHSAALITSPQGLFFQYVLDGNVEKLKAHLIKNSKFINNIWNKTTALHIACSLGLDGIVKVLASFSASVLIEDENGQCALHICAAKYSPDTPEDNAKHLACLENLQSSHNVDVNKEDTNGNTPLHLAVMAGNTAAASLLVKMDASLEVKNKEQQTPLQYCEPPLAFLFKGLANKTDIFIIYQPELQQLVKDISKGLESYYMTSTYTTTDTDAERLISKSTIVLFIVSTETIVSSSALPQLFAADRLKKPVFSLWKDKVKLPPNVENIVFTRQLVDFTNPSHFNESLAQLCVGLRRIVYSDSSVEEEESKIDVQDSKDAADDSDSAGHYAFISYDNSDKAVAEKIKTHLNANSVNCVLSRKYDSNIDAKEILSKKIVACGVFVVLVSHKSAKEPTVRAELALAENYKRPMIPVFVNRNIQLDPSLAYTTANLPKYFLNENCLVELTHVIQIHQRIAANEILTLS